jgi:hypothetical protein
MRGAFVRAGILAAIVFMPAAGGGAAAQSGVTYAHCALDSHTEPFPHARHWRHAYGCLSNQAGFLSQDQLTRMRPL